MKQLILCTTALIHINVIAKISFEHQLNQLKAMPIIQRYREYAFESMKPTTQVFLAEFPNDSKSKVIERYLYQLSIAATMHKFYKKIKNLPETDTPIPEEIRAVYRFVPLNAFVYHIIVNDEIVENVNQLPYDDDFNAKQEWENYLEKIEKQMMKDLQKIHLRKALSLQSN